MRILCGKWNLEIGGRSVFAASAAIYVVLTLCCSFGAEPIVLTNSAEPLKLLPVPWTNGERLRLDIRVPRGTIGVLMYDSREGVADGKKIWKVGARSFGGIEQFSRVEVDPATFKPLHSRWKHTVLGDAEAVYSSNRVDIAIKGKEQKRLELDNAAYDNEEVPQLLRRLDLRTNYDRTINVVSTLSGVVTPVRIEVPKIEKVAVASGEFECFKVDLSLRQTFWISTNSHRYIVKFQTRSFEATLAGIDDLNSKQPVTYSNERAGVSMTAPPGWYFFEADPGELLARIYLLDPEASAHSWLRVQKKESLRQDLRDSLRVWAENDLLDASPFVKDVYPRKDSWREISLAGAPGLRVLSDCVEDRYKKVAYEAVAYAGPTAIEFTSLIYAADFDALLPQVEQIVRSLKPL